MCQSMIIQGVPKIKFMQDVPEIIQDVPKIIQDVLKLYVALKKCDNVSNHYHTGCPKNNIYVGRPKNYTGCPTNCTGYPKIIHSPYKV